VRRGFLILTTHFARLTLTEFKYNLAPNQDLENTSLDFGNHVFLKKSLSDFADDHPLLATFSWNPDYMDYVEDLLKELEDTSNLRDKIKDLRNRESWEGIFSELEFARRLKPLNPEFIKTEQGVSKTPDLKVNLLGKEIFFEVKMLAETDKSSCVSNELSKTESDLVVEFYFGKILDAAGAERLTGFLKNKIGANEIGQFSFEGNNIDIYKKRYATNKRTIVVCGTRIPLELIRKKTFLDFKHDLRQLVTRKPVFLVLDCQRLNYSHDSFENILLGANGLFHLKDAECVNGIVAKIHGRTDLFLNPSAERQLDNDSIRRLRALLEAT
jgi:hypothetical protein